MLEKRCYGCGLTVPQGVTEHKINNPGRPSTTVARWIIIRKEALRETRPFGEALAAQGNIMTERGSAAVDNDGVVVTYALK